jgi:holo-[acyl-carrier-protein] synthase
MGIDIVEIDRVRRILVRRREFVERFFGPEEINYYEIRNMNVSSIAGGFAAKEAVAKALGTGFRSFRWSDIAILPNELGRPVVNLYGKAKEISRGLGIERILVSISHGRDYAVAHALALGGADNENCDVRADEANR